MTQDSLQTTPDDNHAQQALGQDIRALRKTRGLTQDDLAETIGRSIGFISQIERGMSTPSINDLRGLAKRLEVPISWFFDVEANGHKYVVRRGARRELGTREAGLVEQLLSPDLGGSFEILRSVFEPGVASNDIMVRQTEEAGYVVSGQLDLWIAGEWHSLNPGDSFRFENQPHRWRNTGTVRAEVIWVISPPVY